MRNIRYHYGFSGDRLVIGRFCAIAKDVSFIMNDANHALGGLTTYPFAKQEAYEAEAARARFVRSSLTAPSVNTVTLSSRPLPQSMTRCSPSL